VSLVAFASVKGSPGVTTAVVAVAASWPEDRPLLVAEVDPAGGDLAARFGLTEEPGLMSWSAAARRSSAAKELPRHVQELPGGIRLLVAPAGSEQAGGALRLLDARAPGGFDTSQDGDVLADCGRLALSRPSHPLLSEASLLILLVRPALADLAHLASRIEGLRKEAGDVAIVLAGPGPYPAKEVAGTLGVEVLGQLPLDPQGAALCSGAKAGSSRAASRSPLLRAARSLTDALVHRLDATRGREPKATEGVGSRPTAPALEGAG
jgi:hypothetical protein